MLKAKASICSEKLMRTVQRRFSWFELKPLHLYEDPQLSSPCDLLSSNLDNRNLRGRCNKVTLAATATSIAASSAHSRPAGRHRMCRGHPASATVISDHQPTQQRGEHHNEKGGRITFSHRPSVKQIETGRTTGVPGSLGFECGAGVWRRDVGRPRCAA